MAKSYNEELAEWVRQRARSARHEKNRVAFLSVKEDVREALEQGWPVKTIWTHMVEQKRIGFSYDAFLVYVKRHVRSAAEPAVARTFQAPRASPVTPAGGPPASSIESRTPQAPVHAQPVQDQLTGFTFHAAPNREELI
ncbi:TraK family protein [Massilia sp. CT11-137]|uniref:TraK family protein n=1 Tax=Massilia sp. CT11-137 TaxID=3393901 RepID=UPI0039AF0842